METLLNRYRNLTVLLLVVLAQLVLLAYQVKSNQDVRLIRVWAVTAVTPLANVLEFIRENTIGVAINYFVLVNVRSENQRLKEEIGRLKMDNQFLRTELQTAERAEALQAFQARTPSRTIPARIIGTGTGTTSRVVFVDQGTAAGVMRGMAVVTPDGIVGKVLASYPTASQVLLISDPTFAAGVISQKNRVHGTIKGQGQNKCIVDYVQNEEKVEAGEMFFTSGDDRIFPKGMPVGKVSVVRPGKTFKEIYLVPAGFQHGLEEVLIVLEGVHQAIPETQPEPNAPVYIMPAPEAPKQPAAITQSTAPLGAAAQPADAAAGSASLQTDADRIRDRYKRIGEAQGHVYGEGGVGARPPNFNLNPDAAKPQGSPVAPPPGGPPQASSPAAGQTQPQTAAPKPGASPSASPNSGSQTPAPPAAKPKSVQPPPPPTTSPVPQ